ncbi:unnamed protein product [Urochloa humidicola]
MPPMRGHPTADAYRRRSPCLIAIEPGSCARSCSDCEAVAWASVKRTSSVGCYSSGEAAARAFGMRTSGERVSSERTSCERIPHGLLAVERPVIAASCGRMACGPNKGSTRLQRRPRPASARNHHPPRWRRR